MDISVGPNIILYNTLEKYIYDYSNNNNENYNNLFVASHALQDVMENNFIDIDNGIRIDQNNNGEYVYNNNNCSLRKKSEQGLIQEDPWDLSINDDKFYINNKIARIFPVLKNFNNFSKIKIDDESFSFITIREIADITSKIICYHLLEYNLNPQKITIVDYTSGVGGNVLSFSKYFKFVYAIEISIERSEYLKNNVGIYGFENIEVINKCAIEFNSLDLINVNPSVVFVDPPWGGSNYKSNEKLLLGLGSVPIEELIINIASKFSSHYLKLVEANPNEKKNNFNNKFIILKLPKNYDIDHLYRYIKQNNNFPNYNVCTYLYILNKMLIVVCELIYKYI